MHKAVWYSMVAESDATNFGINDQSFDCHLAIVLHKTFDVAICGDQVYSASVMSVLRKTTGWYVSILVIVEVILLRGIPPILNVEVIAYRAARIRTARVSLQQKVRYLEIVSIRVVEADGAIWEVRDNADSV